MLFFEIIIPVLSLVTLGAAYRIVDVGISMAGFPLDSLTPALAPPIYNIDLHVVANSTGGSFSSKQCNDELLMMVYDCQGTERIISTANGSWVYNTNDCWQRKCAVVTTFIDCVASILVPSRSIEVGAYEAAAYRLLSDCALRYTVKQEHTLPNLGSGARALQVPAVMTVVAVAVAALC